MKKSVFTSVLLFVVFALLQVNAMAQSDDKLKAKIEKLNSDLVKAMLAGDHEKNLALYTSDAVSLPSYSPMLVGIEAIRKSNMEMANSGVKIISFEIKTVSVTPAGNLIVEIGTYNMSMTMPGSDQPVPDNGKYITIWEKQADGSLKIKVETWNTDTNPWAQM